MRRRVSIKPERTRRFSIIIIMLSGEKKIKIYPRIKKVILGNGVTIEEVEIEIIQCQVDKKLILSLGSFKKVQTFKNVYEIRVR